MLQPQKRLLSGLAMAGAIVLLCGVPFAPLRIWSNLLIATFYLLTIALGGALFVALTTERSLDELCREELARRGVLQPH